MPMRQCIYEELQELRKSSPSVDDSVCCNEKGFRANPSKISIRWRKCVKRQGISFAGALSRTRVEKNGLMSRFFGFFWQNFASLVPLKKAALRVPAYIRILTIKNS